MGRVLKYHLQGVGFKHPENKLGTGAIYLFEHGGKRFPDFWKKDFVLDAKYKKLASDDNRLGINRDDIHQVMAYMYRLRAQKGGIVYPFNGRNNQFVSEKMHKDSYLGFMSSYGLAIPKNCESYADFVGCISKNENAFIESLL